MTTENIKERKCPPHEETKGSMREICLVVHWDGPDSNQKGPPCFKCIHCYHWIRPHKKNGPCSDCVRNDHMAAGRCPNGHTDIKTDEIRPDVKECLEPRCGSSWGPGWIGWKAQT